MVALERQFRSELLVLGALAIWAAAVAVAPAGNSRLLLAGPPVLAVALVWIVARPQRWLYLLFATLLLTPPLALGSSDWRAHLGMGIAAVGLLVGLLYRAEWDVAKRINRFAVFLIFPLVLLESLTFAALYSGAEIAVASLARVLLFAISIYVFFYAYKGPSRQASPWSLLRFLFASATAAASFACVDFYYQFPAPAGYGPQFVWFTDGVYRRAQGLFYEASTLGNFCVFFLVMIVVALSRPRKELRFNRIGLALAAVVFSAALMFSYSRASLLNLAVAMVALAYVRRLRLSRAIAVLCGAAALAAIAGRTMMPALFNKYWERLALSVQYLWSSPDGVLSGRVTTWSGLLDYISRDPWQMVLGIGYKTLPYSDVAGQNVIADNTYLSLLLETGIVGLAVFLLFNAAILRTAFRAARSGFANASFFGTWMFCFWAGELVQMFSGDLITYWRVLPLYLWVLGVAAREMERSS